MNLSRRLMLALLPACILLLSSASSPDPGSSPYPPPYPQPTRTSVPPPVQPAAEGQTPPVTIWCWSSWPAGIDPPAAFDVVARFKDRQGSRRAASGQVAADDVGDLIQQYRNALQLPRGSRPLAATWQNHAGNRKNRTPCAGTAEANTYWCDRTKVFINALEEQNLPLPSVWLFDTEMTENRSAALYNNCVWPLLRERIGENAVLADWKGGDTAYMPVLYASDWQQNLQRLLEAKRNHPEKEIIPWIAAPGTSRRGDEQTLEAVAKTIEAAAEHGVRRWYLWGDWGNVSLIEARRDWNAIVEAFAATYGEELDVKSP